MVVGIQYYQHNVQKGRIIIATDGVYNLKVHMIRRVSQHDSVKVGGWWKVEKIL